ncbi:hypothetical protein [Streptomyces hygroscopicus]|uniref:hypothetical protein n=1 Tax=Streptomyces hygroscopicus TaxID=1912 RepID=UPI00117E91A5|nr:hypothetical protein [Streptomyces hygroscopicus]
MPQLFGGHGVVLAGGLERGLDGRRAFVVRVVQDGCHHEVEVLGIDEHRFAEVETEHKDHFLW